MSVRVEWTEATLLSPLLYERGQVLDDGQEVTSDYALVIGPNNPLAIEGTGAELEDALRYALAIVRGEE